jgi:hypothetical protein
MAWQPSAFQPSPRPSLSERFARLGEAIRAFALPAKGVPALGETAWQRGKKQASELANRRAIQFMIVCAPIFAVGGLLFALPGFWWPLRVLLAALIGLGVAIVAAFVVAGYYALRAPRRQRDEARGYARALESYAEGLSQRAARRELADDFRRETLEFARAVFEGNWHQPASALDTHWRQNASAMRALLLDRGAGDDVAAEFDRQLEVLDAKDDGYGDDEIRRLASSMQSTCQNVWSLVRGEPPPTAPTPAAGAGS